MPLYAFSIVSLLIQVGLIVHVVRTGRSWLWIAAIGFLPGAGSIAYVVVELLPELFGGRAARRAKTGVERILDPNRGLRQANAEVEISGNVDARRRLADELIARGQFDRAIEVYGGGLTGIFEHDPALLLGLARAQFAKQDFAAARVTLQRLGDNNPDFKSADARLLYARTLEAAGALEEAEREYAASAPSYPGAEARLRYGLLLKRRGKTEESRRVLKDLLDSAEIGPRHYRKAQAEWLQLARSEL
ncbi:MAG TPA: tetratricopeptide repeat protein [Steroidobacteraceae bacterium]|nr:tetratricopeptide repeat protein [Steroidobacteraceae bacterium]